MHEGQPGSMEKVEINSEIRIIPESSLLPVSVARTAICTKTFVNFEFLITHVCLSMVRSLAAKSQNNP